MTPADRLPVEIWVDILLLAVEPDAGPSVFATTCTASTFIHFITQENYSYIEYVRRRATLRRVCRAWNETVLSTDCWWIHLSTPTQILVSPSTTDQVRTIKRLSMAAMDRQYVEHWVNWASDVLQRVQTPLITYDVTFPLCNDGYYACPKTHALHDFLPGVGSKIALRRLRVVFPNLNHCRTISFSHLNANFKNLVSLSLCNLIVFSPQELTLPHLEVLHLATFMGALPSPTQEWDLPRLRHVCVDGNLHPPYIDYWLKFLRRYASQLETLFLSVQSRWDDFPLDFWDSFTALQLLGLPYNVLTDRGWGGWITTPPRTHPFRYLVCRYCSDVVATVDSLESIWTYHGEVGLVIEGDNSGQYYLIEDIEEKGWKTRMTESDGILPDRRQSHD